MRVLVVDDTVTYRAIITKALEGIPSVEVVGAAANGKIALQKIDQFQPDILTLDVEMPEMDGLDVLRRLRDMKSDIGVIMLSAFTTEGAKATVEALNLGAFDFVVKPNGADADANAGKLRQELRLKIEAFVKAREIRNILHGGTVARPGAAVSVAPASRQAAAVGAHHLSPWSDQPAHALWLTEQIEVVALGISTGGPQALMRLLPQLPANFAVPMLIVQHMPPIFTKSLADDLDRRCKLRVAEAVDGQAVASGTILIAPGGRQMKVERAGAARVVRITTDPPENSCSPSVDYLFRSVADAYGRKALGVLMTGMGSDGAAGCRLLHQRGAPLLAQNEASCVVFGMPREPIQEGIAKAVPLESMADEIIQLVGRREQHLAGNL